MASNAKKKTTFAKMNRENAVREKRLRKQAKKDAKKQALAAPPCRGERHADRPRGLAASGRQLEAAVPALAAEARVVSAGAEAVYVQGAVDQPCVAGDELCGSVEVDHSARVANLRAA